MRLFLPLGLFNQFLGLVHLTVPQTAVQYNWRRWHGSKQEYLQARVERTVYIRMAAKGNIRWTAEPQRKPHDFHQGWIQQDAIYKVRRKKAYKVKSQDWQNAQMSHFTDEGWEWIPNADSYCSYHSGKNHSPFFCSSGERNAHFWVRPTPQHGACSTQWEGNFLELT